MHEVEVVRLFYKATLRICMLLVSVSRRLTSSWWECYGVCLRYSPTELAHSFFFFLFFNSVLLSVSVFVALSTVFHPISSHDNSPLSYCVLPVSFLPRWSFQLYVSLWESPSAPSPPGSPSRGGGCYGLCLRHKPAELAHSFYSVLVSVSVFMALSTVFYSINSPDNSPLSHSVLLVVFLPY